MSIGVPTRITLRDVAAQAGVAPSTVSKALSGKGRVSAATRDYVTRVADSLGYRNPTNEAPAGLMVGLLTLDGYNRFTPELMGGIEDSLARSSCAVVLGDARSDDVRLRHYLNTMVRRGVHGIVVVGRHTNPCPPLHRELGVGIPLVYAYAVPTDETVPCVTVDDTMGGYQAGRQLLRDQRRRLAVIAGPRSYDATRDRLVGFKAALAEAGLELPEELIIHGRWAEATGREALPALLHRDPSIDGVCCFSDQIARGAADYAITAGIDIPGQIALIGYDNWTDIAEATRPPLTTIDPSLRAVGRIAANALVALIAGKTVTGRRRVPPSILVRESCPTPAGEDAYTPFATPSVVLH